MLELPLLFFILGAIAASFVGVVASRLNTGAPIVAGRSRCDSCGHMLQPLALVPILSWAIAGGRCLACRARISIFSTLTEIALGSLFVLAYLKLGLSIALVAFLISLVLLAGIVLYDLMHSIIPPLMLALFLIAAALTNFAASPNMHQMLVAWCIALLLGSSLAFIHLVSRGRAMGLSDAPLAFALALLTAPFAVSGFIFSFWVGATIGIIILVKAPKGARIGIEVPFAPFLAAGFLLAYFTSWDALTLISSLLSQS